jgi:PadR family transcriptional regulator, regulatory protein PadR
MPRPRRDEMSALYLTTLEEELLSLLIGRELYSVEIERAFREVLGRKRNFGSFYPTLRKLEKQGFLEARWGDEEPADRGGPRRRYYKTSGLGEDALKEAENNRQRLRGWKLAPQGGFL